MTLWLDSSSGRTYKLQLCEIEREKNNSRCFLTGKSLIMRSAWDKNSVEARLDHFRKKAELRIIDHGPQMWCHPESGGEDELARRSLRFYSGARPYANPEPPRPSTIFSPSFSKAPKRSPRSTQLPEELWRRIARVQPEVFFDGCFAVSPFARMFAFREIHVYFRGQ
jgi:hypothetical protein